MYTQEEILQMESNSTSYKKLKSIGQIEYDIAGDSFYFFEKGNNEGIWLGRHTSFKGDDGTYIMACIKKQISHF